MRPNRTGRGGVAAKAPAKGLAELKQLHKQAKAQANLAPPEPPSAKAERAAPRNRLDTTAKQGLTAADIALFRRAVKLVTPIKDTKRAVFSSLPTAAPELLRQRRQRATGQDAPRPVTLSDHFQPVRSDHDDSRFVRERHAADLIKGLKRGKWPVGATLDLHGSTLDQARERLDRFLGSCLTHQVRCVRIVHGKGYGSRDGEPVLKQTIRRWLTQMECVLAYIECAEHEGGSGAVQVLLHISPAPLSSTVHPES
ncbi:Smr/MutS family protein [Allopusillimonas ginsengisoli]|uniref:Smr/MutS family protein n=1 Tax=Allopusillimonas ginsengisoli TaxID=453575 RepID=UPI001431E69A|nr:Smr/MutS family protein [Allopusillimonas ginsengisoli]